MPSPMRGTPSARLGATGTHERMSIAYWQVRVCGRRSSPRNYASKPASRSRGWWCEGGNPPTSTALGLPRCPTGRWYRAVMHGGRLVGATGCVLLVVSVLAVTGSAAPPELRWRPLLHVPTIVDVVGPRTDGQLVLSTRRGLLLARPGRPATEFARGPAGYVAVGGEPYIALAPARRLPNARCSFKRDDVFALDADLTPGVVRIGRTGQAARVVDFPADASLPVSPSTSSAGSAIASSSQRLSPARPLSTQSTASAAVRWWYETRHESKGA